MWYTPVTTGECRSTRSRWVWCWTLLFHQSTFISWLHSHLSSELLARVAKLDVQIMVAVHASLDLVRASNLNIPIQLLLKVCLQNLHIFRYNAACEAKMSCQWWSGQQVSMCPCKQKHSLWLCRKLQSAERGSNLIWESMCKQVARF